MDNQLQAPADRILSRAQFRELTGISRTYEWRLGQDGKLPAVVKIDGHVLGYKESDYLDWLARYSV